MREELFNKEMLANFILAKTPIKYAKINSITKIVVHPTTHFVKYRINATVKPRGFFTKKIPMNIDVFETDIKAHQKLGRNYQQAFYCAAVCTILGL